MWPFKKKEIEIETSVVELKPGICECDHNRCYHEKGVGRCHVNMDHTHKKEDLQGIHWRCACEIYIRKSDSGGDNPPEIPDDPEVVELKKIAGLT